MTSLPELFTKKQHIYHCNKSQLLKIFDPTLFLTSTVWKDALILNFSARVNSGRCYHCQNFQRICRWSYEIFPNLFSAFSRIDIVCDGYFDNSLKSHTRKLVVVDMFFIYGSNQCTKGLPRQFFKAQ